MTEGELSPDGTVEGGPSLASGRAPSGETPGWLMVLDLLISVAWTGLLAMFAVLFIGWPLPDHIGAPMEDSSVWFWVKACLPRTATFLGLTMLLFVLHTGAVRFLCDDRRARGFLFVARGVLASAVVFAVLGASVQFVVERPWF